MILFFDTANLDQIKEAYDMGVLDGVTTNPSLMAKEGITVFIMGWALLTCYSRIYLGVHFPGDLLAGTLIGLIAAYIVYRLFQKVSGHKTMEKVPHIYAPILVGGLTILGIFIYSAVMVL